MQQTEKYKLNLIETSDTFSPHPLNENAQKLETQLSAETAARAAGDAALDQRVTVLEARKIVTGTYIGNAPIGNSSIWQSIYLGFTPRIVVILPSSYVWIASDVHPMNFLAIEEGGFKVKNGTGTINNVNSTYGFFAIL